VSRVRATSRPSSSLPWLPPAGPPCCRSRPEWRPALHCCGLCIRPSHHRCGSASPWASSSPGSPLSRLGGDRSGGAVACPSPPRRNGVHGTARPPYAANNPPTRSSGSARPSVTAERAPALGWAAGRDGYRQPWEVNRSGEHQYLRCRKCNRGGLGAPHPMQVYERLVADVLKVLGDEEVQVREYEQSAEARKEEALGGVHRPLGRVFKVPPGPRRLARHLAALSESTEYARYEADPPPCDAPHQTPRAPPCGRTALL
jgi:hypothetical protein